MVAVTDKLLAALKRHNPAKVRAYSGDDDIRDIAVPTRRKRWSAVIEVIESRSWSRVELMTRSGEILGVVDNTSPAGDVEDVGAESRAAKTRSEAEWIVQLVVRAQREALTFRDAEVTQLLQAQGAVVRELTNGMQALTAMYQAQVQAAHELATVQAQAASGGDSELKQLLEAAPQLLQALPLIRGLLGGGASSPVTNGVRKAT